VKLASANQEDIVSKVKMGLAKWKIIISKLETGRGNEEIGVVMKKCLMGNR
jgi:hypothetical protein